MASTPELSKKSDRSPKAIANGAFTAMQVIVGLKTGPMHLTWLCVQRKQEWRDHPRKAQGVAAGVKCSNQYSGQHDAIAIRPGQPRSIGFQVHTSLFRDDKVDPKDPRLKALKFQGDLTPGGRDQNLGKLGQD